MSFNLWASKGAKPLEIWVLGTQWQQNVKVENKMFVSNVCVAWWYCMFSVNIGQKVKVQLP